MLVNSKEILLAAKKGNYGVPAPDYFDLDSARCFVEVAEELQKPMILSFAQVHCEMGLMTLEEAGLIGRYLGERAGVPIVLHLDHGTDEAFIKKAIDLGFTSVMLDASMESFEVNVRRTKAMADYAHAHGVTIEAEIGHVGTGENYNGDGDSDSVYTTVEEAVEFECRTGVDSLAVSIGTAHGLYKNCRQPVIYFERLHQLAAAVKAPLVLHGSSGSGEENLRRCAAEGISKVNVLTDFLTGAMKAVREKNPSGYLELKAAANEGMKQMLRHCFWLYGQIVSNSV